MDDKHNEQLPQPYAAGAQDEQARFYGHPGGDGFRFPPKPKHSGPGIASFILSLAMLVSSMVIIVAVTAITLSLTPPGHIPNESTLVSEPTIVLSGLLLMAVAVGLLIGLVLGIIGLFQSNRNKLFAVLGTIFNAFGLFVYFILFAIGFAFR